MTDKQRRFADEYLIDLNATRAYKAAYPSVKRDETAAAAASRLLSFVKVQEYIKEHMQQRQERVQITQDEVVTALKGPCSSQRGETGTGRFASDGRAGEYRLERGLVRMAKNTEARPEWFKFWRRNRRQLDIEQLDMKSRGIIFTNMMRYFDGDDSELLEMTPLECMAFNVLKINVDDTFSDYAATSAQNRANANKRWQRSNADEYDRMRAHANHAEDRSQKTEDRSQKTEDRSGERTADKPPRATRFTPPTVEEVTAYCRERQNGVDAQRFVDFYTSKGWKVGRESMKDWRAAVRNWERREQGGSDIRSAARYTYREEESL